MDLQVCSSLNKYVLHQHIATKGNTVGNAIPGVFFYYGDYTATTAGSKQLRLHKAILLTISLHHLMQKV